MLKALFWKEFRETLPLLIALLAVEGYLIWGAQHGSLSGGPPMISIDSAWIFIFIAGLVFPVVFGLWQGARETQQNTFQFLLHRPLRRDWIFMCKILFGTAICLFLVAMPIAWFSNWAEQRTARRYMWELAKPLCAGILLLYSGAFLSMVRPARAMGSQFVPLLGSVLLLSMLLSTSDMFAERAPSVWQAFTTGAGVVVDAVFVIAILRVANTRDYS